MEDNPLTKLLEFSKCLDTSAAFIRGNKVRKDYAFVTVMFVPCVLDPAPGVECAPIVDFTSANFVIDGYAIAKKVMMSDKEDSLQNRMINFRVNQDAIIAYELATNSLTL